MTPQKVPVNIRWSLVVPVFIVFTLIVSFVGRAHYLQQKNAHMESVRGKLDAIAHLKAAHISDWREEMLRDAMERIENSPLTSLIERFIEDPADTATRRILQRWLRVPCRIWHFRSAIIADTSGIVFLSYGNADFNTNPQLGRLSARAVRMGHPLLTDLHMAEDGSIHLPLIIPLIYTRHPHDFVAFEIDPETRLYPLIRSWPTASKSGESLLIRRDGDQVLFLSNLRYKDGTALRLRLPLSSPELPAAMALRGETGVVTGIDYRGKQVLAVLKNIPNSPWQIVAKVDIDEVNTPLNSYLFYTLALVLMVIATTGLILFLYYRVRVSRLRLGHAETELKQKVLEQRYDYLSRYANDAIFLLGSDRRIVEANDRATELYGYPRDKLTGLSTDELQSEAESERLERQLAKLSARDGIVLDALHRRANGTEFPVEESVRVIETDGPYLYQFIIRDITDRKREEEKREKLLHELKKRVKELNCMFGVTESIRKRGTIEEVLTDVTAIIPSGWQYPEITYGKVRFEGNEYAPSECEETEWMLSSDIIIGDNKQGTVEVHYAGKHDAVEVYYTEERPAEDEGPFLKEERDLLDGIARTLSEAIGRKRAEEELAREKDLLEEKVAERTVELSDANEELARANRLKDAFVANMSHEMRTPLNSILGFGELLQEEIHGTLTAQQKLYLSNIETSGKGILALINDILDVARIESGKLEIHREWIDATRACDAALMVTGQSAVKKNITLENMIDQNLPDIFADEYRLRQILVNLLSNAMKFTPKGGRAGLRVEQHEDRERVMFAVWDTGIGISEEDMQYLFQPFVQLDGGLSRSQEGIGLGLSMVGRLTELHGGSVQVESRLGEGSTFTVTLPYGDRSGYEADEGSTHVAPDMATSHDATPVILLVEDSEDTALVVSDYLVFVGMDVIGAGNGLEAVTKAETASPDLIIMDIQMPQMDGLEAIRRIRSSGGEKRVPIIAVTALAMHGDRERCMAAGADGYMSKPLSLQELVTTIRSMLDNGPEGNPLT